MTLILGMSKPEGVYMSADYWVTRRTQSGTVELVDDASVKFLTVNYPPYEGGPKALFGYCGLAQLPDGTSTGDWLRETLRGEAEVFDASIQHLHERLVRDVQPLGDSLDIVALVVHEGRRSLAGHSNMRDPAKGFHYLVQEFTDPFKFAQGSGANLALESGADRELLLDQLEIRPRSVDDHMGLLAAVNRRVAAKEPTVSPFCHVAYINADESTSAKAKVYQESQATPTCRSRCPCSSWG